jgi:hypothetical protein
MANDKNTAAAECTGTPPFSLLIYYTIIKGISQEIIAVCGARCPANSSGQLPVVSGQNDAKASKSVRWSLATGHWSLTKR